MNKSKRRVGYRTPISELHDKFEEIDNWISSKQKMWSDIMEIATKNTNELKKEFQKEFKSETRDLKLIDLISTERQFWNIIGFFGSLGLDITENQEKLNKIEKEIKELKLKLK